MVLPRVASKADPWAALMVLTKAVETVAMMVVWRGKQRVETRVSLMDAKLVAETDAD